MVGLQKQNEGKQNSFMGLLNYWNLQEMDPWS